MISEKATANNSDIKDSQKSAILANALYSRAEASDLTGVAQITLIRATDAGHLKSYRVGRRVIYSGSQILNWLEEGGKTAARRGGSK